jgi:hypothetical protein
VQKFYQSVLAYHFNLSPDIELPKGVGWLIPYTEKETRYCMTSFYQKFYNDNRKRTYILGINPGRLGAGLTGVPFTDPICLANLGVENSFPKKHELSSIFVHEMIDAYGGHETFFNRFYITSLSPLGFIREGKNYNYYDDATLSRVIRPFIIESIEAQLLFGCDRSKVYCLGQGKNFDYLNKLNEEFQWWERVIPLPHPRWIMQYRRKRKEEFLDLYKEFLLTS